MFVYYKLYREPVSPTISTRRCGDQEKTSVPGVEVVHDKARSVRSFFLKSFYFGTNVLLLCWPVDRSCYNLNKLETEVANPVALTLTTSNSSESECWRVCASIGAEETAAHASQLW